MNLHMLGPTRTHTKYETIELVPVCVCCSGYMLATKTISEWQIELAKQRLSEFFDSLRKVREREREKNRRKNQWYVYVCGT